MSDSQRKDDHLRLALQQSDRTYNAFDDIHIMHHSLAACDVEHVDTSTLVCGARWEVPFYINAMTGGSERTGSVNTALAQAAGTTHVAMASGSQHAAIRDASLTDTFTTIRQHTDGFVFANVGPTVTPEQAVEAVHMLQANALQIHINAAQEIVMPEGNRHFETWPERIAAIVRAVPVPVVVKEVGFGMSAQTIRQLAGLGVRTVDVSGRGGTDFARIEHERRSGREYGYMAEWGQSTVLSLLTVFGASSSSFVHPASAMRSASPAMPAADATHVPPAAQPVTTPASSSAEHGTPAASSVPPAIAMPDVIASGGVRNPLDVLKALALGAKAVGVSGHFLRTLQERGEQALVDEITSWGRQLTGLMALVGARSVSELSRVDVLVTGVTAEHARLLGVDVRTLVRRSESHHADPDRTQSQA